MNIRELIPVDIPPHLSGMVYEELSSFLYDFSQHKHPDTKAGPTAIRIIVAFVALEREGTIEAFRLGLRPAYFNASGR